MSKEKKNPKIMLTESKLRAIKRECTNQAMDSILAIFLTVMRDKEGYGRERIIRLYKRIVELSDTIYEGYVSIDDLKKVLQDECGIVINGSLKNKVKKR